MITGFFRSSRQEESIGFPSYFSGDVFISHAFSWYIFIMSTLPHFPVDCMDSHLRLFSLPRLSCSVSYHRKPTVQNVYKDIKIYIFLCPPSTSDCCFCLDLSSLLQTHKQPRPNDPTSNFPCSPFLSFKPEIVSKVSSCFRRSLSHWFAMWPGQSPPA